MHLCIFAGSSQSIRVLFTVCVETNVMLAVALEPGNNKPNSENNPQAYDIACVRPPLSTDKNTLNLKALNHGP